MKTKEDVFTVNFIRALECSALRRKINFRDIILLRMLNENTNTFITILIVPTIIIVIIFFSIR